MFLGGRIRKHRGLKPVAELQVALVRFSDFGGNGVGIVGVGVAGNRLQLLLARIQSALIPMDFEFVDVCQLPGFGDWRSVAEYGS
jgi:hypothetical protein